MRRAAVVVVARRSAQMRLLGLLDRDPFEGLETRASAPAVNVYGVPDGWRIRVELPGVAPENIEIESRGRTLRISGKREEPAPAQGDFVRRERWSGEFSRSLRLPAELDVSRAEASCRHGVLEVSVPRREELQPRRIEIRSDQGKLDTVGGEA
jgi:HSP20 family protein